MTQLQKFQYYNIAAIQETRINDQTQLDTFQYLTKDQYQGKVYVPQDELTKNHEYGIATIIHPTFPDHDKFLVDTRSIKRRYLLLKQNTTWGTIYIHNIHAPAKPKNHPKWISELPTNFEDDAKHIVLGDFNVTLSKLDHSSANPDIAGRKELQTWIENLDLIDPWHTTHQLDRVYSSPNATTRIDFIFISLELFHKFYADSGFTQWNTKQKSNHSKFPYLTLQQIPQTTGKEFWQCPLWLIPRQDTREYIHNAIQNLAFNFHTHKNKTRKWIKWKNETTKWLRKQQRLINPEAKKQLQQLQ